jgi:hypothetical protein
MEVENGKWAEKKKNNFYLNFENIFVYLALGMNILYLTKILFKENLPLNNGRLWGGENLMSRVVPHVSVLNFSKETVSQDLFWDFFLAHGHASLAWMISVKKNFWN